MDSRYKKNDTIIHWAQGLLCCYQIYCCDAHPPMESGKYISWFSSTFSAVSFFRVPLKKKKKEQRARIRKASTTAQISYWLSLAGTQQRGRSITHQLIRFIHTVNTVMAIAVVINHDFNSSVCMNLKDFISLVFCKRDGSKYAIQNYDCQ